MPQTFSPQTRVTPLMAAPMAKCSQFFRAISVEPSAPVKTGASILTLRSQPYSVSTFDVGEGAGVGVGLDPFGQALAAQRVALDVQVRVVDGVVLVAAGRDLAEGPGIDELAAAEGGLEDLAVAAAPVDAAGAEPEPGTTLRERLDVWETSFALGR